MGAHNILHKIRRLRELGEANIDNPGAGGTFNLRGKTDATVTLTASGTYTLPNAAAGTRLQVCVDDTSTITLADSTGTFKVFTGTTGTSFCDCVASDSNSWSGEIYTQNASGDVAASAVSFADASDYSGATNVEAGLSEVYERTDAMVDTAISTAVGGTLTAAGLVGGLITRTGPTAAYSDATATAAQIIALLPQTSLDSSGGYSRVVTIKNTVAFNQTITAGDAGVTLTPSTMILPPNSVTTFLLQYATADSIIITRLSSVAQCVLPVAQFDTAAGASATAAAGILTGANEVFYQVTDDGGFALTTRTATQMFGDIPNCHIGFKYLLTLINRGNGTLTVTPGTNVTMAEATTATLLTQTYQIEFTSATACTATKVRTGTTPT